MKKYLAEGWEDFETVNIEDMFSNAAATTNTASATETNNKETTEDSKATQASGNAEDKDKKDEAKPQNNKDVTDWDKELKNRLEANKALSSEAKVPEYQIEDQFFKEYYNESGIWDEKCAKVLLEIGTPLKKAFKVLGFNKMTNPLLGFISQDYVKKTLLATGLLNANTFKAIYNAVADHKVADSEFLTYRDYNIIYCPSLYKKSLTDIEKYLDLQKSCLKPDANKYTLDAQIKNKKAFINLEYIKEVSSENDIKKRLGIIASVEADKIKKMSDSTVELNSIKFAETILGKVDNVTPNSVHISKDKQTAILDELTSPYQMFALLQYLFINANSSKAKEALADSKFSSLSSSDIIKATEWLVTSKLIPAGKLASEDANDIAEAIIKKLG
jgi:hypothetical protein